MVSQDEINSNFLDVIRWLKSEYGYTQAYIVEKAELAPNAISKIKNGKANAGDETITKLCNAFNLNSDYFYGRSSCKTKPEESEAKLDENIRQVQASIQSQPYIDPGSQMNAAIAALKRREQQIQQQVLGHVVTHSSSEGYAADDPRPNLPTWADTLLEILSKQIAENEALHAQLRQSIDEINEIKTQLSKIISK